MLAIPVFRSRVAPVLNWCSKIFIIHENETDAAAGREIVLYDMSGFDRLRALRTRGVDTLICGALSTRLLHYGENLGLHIIHGVAGQIDEVLRAYHERQLDQPFFRLPGCQPGRHHLGGRNCARSDASECGLGGHRRRAHGGGPDGGDVVADPGRESGLSSAKRSARKRAKTEPCGFCICLQCGAELPHGRRVPCVHRRCPVCGHPIGTE